MMSDDELTDGDGLSRECLDTNPPGLSREELVEAIASSPDDLQAMVDGTTFTNDTDMDSLTDGDGSGLSPEQSLKSLVTKSEVSKIGSEISLGDWVSISRDGGLYKGYLIAEKTTSWILAHGIIREGDSIEPIGNKFSVSKIGSEISLGGVSDESS
jgi:hypothetical protein